MKAIFAVTALAAAISGQALAADTEASTTFTGTMDAAFTIDLENELQGVDLVEDDDDDEGYELTMSVDVVNGPLSASIGIEAYDNDLDGDDSLEDNVTVFIGDIVVTEGKFSFGQVGNLMATDTYVESSVEMSDEVTATVLADEIGFRYMVAEGATVQLGGAAGEAGTYYLAGQYTSEVDALAFTVEAEAKMDSTAADGADTPMFVGAGVTYTLDVATVTAGYNMTSDAAGESDSEYAVDVQSTLGDATVGLGYYEPSTEGDDDEELVVEASYAIDAITVSAGYTLTTAESTGDELTAGLAWAEDMLSASADVTIENFDADEADDALIELNATYTSESGVEYYGDYAFQADSSNKITLGGRYSF